ncbi:MAG: alpha/beta-hydrolase family protein [Actinobacteria bacterium]|nr:alpha/beta-hydrolase family protein [Actinomycetota bacterium]
MSRRTGTVFGGALGALVAGAESFRPSLVPRATIQQTLITGSVATTGAALGGVIGGVVGAALAARRSGQRLSNGQALTRLGIGAGALAGTSVMAIRRAMKFRQAQLTSYTGWGEHYQNPRVAGTGGLALAGAAGLATTGVSTAVSEASSALAERYAGPRWMWHGLTSGGVAMLAVFGSKWSRALLYRVLAKDGDEPDAALTDAPDDPHVTGGPGSLVAYDTLSREGRRFVNWRVPAHEIDTALGVEGAVEPIRVFVGVNSAGSLVERVDLAIAELDRLGAFERAAILAVSPAGSGYANSVPVEAMELALRGDCATVVVQYGLLPSMFSTHLRPLASETYRALFDRLRLRIDQQPPEQRPKLFGYGESLGALTAERALEAQPNLLDVRTAHVKGLDAAVFVGTPGGESIRDKLLGSPLIVHVDRWQQLADTDHDGVQLFFLDHDADPVTRFAAPLLHKRPEWLRPAKDRGRNIPDEMKWYPIITWQQVMIDLAYATQSQSGVFRSVGHDYRADLAPVIMAAFAPDSELSVDQVQQILAAREVARDSLLSQEQPEDTRRASDTAASKSGDKVAEPDA